MKNKIRFGILSTAKIAREKVIPALQSAKFCTVEAIASRNSEQAKQTAALLGIAKAYDSYEALLADPDIDAVYIPLPNHLHVPWSVKALEANKHVLCEKPIALNASEAKVLEAIAAQKPALKIMEAFMYRFHPQWQRTLQLVQDRAIGELKTVHSFFSYYNADEQNIRNKKEMGGGGLMDIGCYCVSLSRLLFAEEPLSVTGQIELDPILQTDRVSSGILQFRKGTATFTCSTQLMSYQRVNILGTTGRIEIEIPFNAPPLLETRIWLHTSAGTEEIVFAAVDQYSLQADLFSKAILDNTAVPTGLNDASNNMLVIDAVFQSALENRSIPLSQ
jgi:predicted dehydrogenase